MTTRRPPVPAANRSSKGPGADPKANQKAACSTRRPPENLAEQGHQGNVKQNTTHPGYLQDR